MAEDAISVGVHSLNTGSVCAMLTLVHSSSHKMASRTSPLSYPAVVCWTALCSFGPHNITHSYWS